MIQIRDKLSETTDAVYRTREAREQIEEREGAAGGEVSEAAAKRIKELLDIEGKLTRLVGPNRRCCTARSKSLTSLMPVAESPGAVRIGHPERGHLVEYLAPNSVFNSLPRQRSCSHLRPDDRFVTIDRVLHHASLGEA